MQDWQIIRGGICYFWIAGREENPEKLSEIFLLLFYMADLCYNFDDKYIA
jgi:hypothetical protein